MQDSACIAGTPCTPGKASTARDTASQASTHPGVPAALRQQVVQSLAAAVLHLCGVDGMQGGRPIRYVHSYVWWMEMQGGGRISAGRSRVGRRGADRLRSMAASAGTRRPPAQASNRLQGAPGGRAAPHTRPCTTQCWSGAAWTSGPPPAIAEHECGHNKVDQQLACGLDIRPASCTCVAEYSVATRAGEGRTVVAQLGSTRCNCAAAGLASGSPPTETARLRTRNCASSSKLRPVPTRAGVCRRTGVLTDGLPNQTQCPSTAVLLMVPRPKRPCLLELARDAALMHRVCCSRRLVAAQDLDSNCKEGANSRRE